MYVDEDHIKEVQKQRKDLVKFMKIARERGHGATLMYNNLKINGIMYTLEQLGEKQAGKKVCEQPNMTSNPKRTASDRSPYEKEEKGGRAYKMMRNITNTDRTSKERDIIGTGENDWKQKTSNRKLWNKICDKV